MVRGPPEIIARIRQLEAKEGTQRPPIPGLETVTFLVGRAYRWWRPKQPQQSSDEEQMADARTEKRSATLAHFRAAGQSVSSGRQECPKPFLENQTSDRHTFFCKSALFDQ